jgi:glycine/D-amino acid oxidase-like deaminating enzyme
VKRPAAPPEFPETERVTDRTLGIVGGGIVGLAIGRELALRHPSASVVVFEKEDHIGRHQTGHNSGVVHAGIYYKPGSLKAELCTLGRSLIQEYCAERKLPYNECGKLVVAVDADEMDRFDKLEATARQNGVPGLCRVDGSGIAEIEPHARGHRLRRHRPRVRRRHRGRRWADPPVHPGHRDHAAGRGHRGGHAAADPSRRPPRGLRRTAVRPDVAAGRR